MLYTLTFSLFQARKKKKMLITFNSSKQSPLNQAFSLGVILPQWGKNRLLGKHKKIHSIMVWGPPKGHRT